MLFNFHIVYAYENDNFSLAIKSAFQNSLKIKSGNFKFLSKQKLLKSSN